MPEFDAATRALLQVLRCRLRQENDRWVIEAVANPSLGAEPVALHWQRFDDLLLLLAQWLGDEPFIPMEAAQTAVAAVADQLSASPRSAALSVRELLAGDEPALANMLGLPLPRSPRPDSPYPWDRPQTSDPDRVGSAP